MSRRVASDPKPSAVDRLTGVQIDPESGLHIGTLMIGRQWLRVGIRPLPPGAVPAGPPLLLFNGIGANMELAAPLMATLNGVETLIFDLPGAGKSPPPRFPYRLFSMARLARRLLDALGYGKVDVMGVSWGGGLAQQFTIQYPKRVRRLVLAATAMGGATMLPGHPRVLLKMINPRRYGDKGYMKRVAPELYGGDLRHDPRRHQAVHRPCARRRRQRLPLPAVGHARLDQPAVAVAHPPSDAGAGRQRRSAGAADQCPLACLAAARCAARDAWLLRDARLHVFDDGHLFLLTRARETAAAIAGFLVEPAT